MGVLAVIIENPGRTVQDALDILDEASKVPAGLLDTQKEADVPQKAPTS